MNVDLGAVAQPDRHCDCSLVTLGHGRGIYVAARAREREARDNKDDATHLWRLLLEANSESTKARPKADSGFRTALRLPQGVVNLIAVALSGRTPEWPAGPDS